MEYMPILPVGMMDLYETNDIFNAFVLPQLWEIPEYRKVFQELEWDTVIIDNAMYEQEEAIEFSKLIDIANSIETSETYIVCPEDMGNPKRSIQLTEDTISQYGCYDDHWRLMSVLSGNPMDINTQYYALKKYPIGFGIPVSSWRKGYDRASILSYIGFDVNKHYVHAMGLDSCFEAIALAKAGFSSVDSSIVATAAVNSINLDECTTIIRKGSIEDPKRVDLTQSIFPGEVVYETISNVDFMMATVEGYSCRTSGKIAYGLEKMTIPHQ